MARILVVGGSVAGLGAALAFARAGHAVRVLERDATPVPDSPVEAFEKWERRGAPQVRHSHAFLARLRNLLRDRMPDVLEALHEAGAEDLPLERMLPPELDDRAPRPGDADLTMLGCRRLTFEWVLRRVAAREPGVEIHDGVEVRGLVAARREGAGGVPVVAGVRARAEGGAEETLEAELVVDAGGRRSRLGGWLEALGARPEPEESEPCGIFYTSRFYRLAEGAEAPQGQTAIGADMGYLKYGIFLGDGGIFSVTLAASREDPPLRALLRAGPFEEAARAIPATAAWVEPGRAEPLTGVHGMASLRNTRRRLVREDGEPVALGVAAVGDAAIHTNPLYGRGCSFALVHACMLADAFGEHEGDPRALARAFDAATRREIVPWYELARRQDRDAADEAARLRAGGAADLGPEAAASSPKLFMRDVVRRGLRPAIRRDATVLRAFLRSLNLLDPPDDLMKRPEVLQRVMAFYEARHEREEPVLGPDREAMVELLERAAA